MRFVQLYLDHPQAGCGFRRFFVVHEGKVNARLFSPADCRSITVPLAWVNDRKTKDLTPANRREAAKVAAVIRDNFKMRKRLHMLVNGNDAKAVMNDLKAVAA